MFSTTLALSLCFHLSTLIRLHSKTILFYTFPPAYRPKSPKTNGKMETILYDAFFGTIFKGLRFHLFTLETELFQNHLVSKDFTSVFISFLDHFCVDHSRQCIKKCAFSYVFKCFQTHSCGWLLRDDSSIFLAAEVRI